jgi:hypothetical protein
MVRRQPIITEPLAEIYRGFLHQTYASKKPPNISGLSLIIYLADCVKSRIERIPVQRMTR